MKRINILIIVTAMLACQAAKGQTVAVKTNLLTYATTTLNLGLEIELSPKWTLDLPVNYNNWGVFVPGVFESNSKVRISMIQPEARYWFCQKFYGHFVGLHGFLGDISMVGDFAKMGLEDNRRYVTDSFYGAGLSYGYHWMINKRLSIEATFGIGHVSGKYVECTDKPKCTYEGDKNSKSDVDLPFIVPTKAGVSLIYIIK
jgi:hypothetical protein